ncbi:MAG: hydroxymethylglutaryl-CoA synthase [Candidatus Schekmanbacteria bacterium]|nr:hydroxymethylglutaryl-CoA synthase [Candidatus Schekmanbacteria bacterium]
MDVGIDAIAFFGPQRYLDMADLARARGVDPAKYTRGLGQLRMAIATPCEDSVTLAANAAALALKRFDVDPQQIGTLVVGTETGIDHSKPVAVYVHEALKLRRCCRTFETKHACYGAFAGLTAASDWILSGRARGYKALIIASDIARYGVGELGEPTQGAGAVAMVVSENPRLITFDPLVTGDYTRQVMDFWRPLYSKFAFADGHYSIACYLEALAACRADALAKAADAEEYAIAKLSACFYHVPFVKMAKKAHQRHWEAELGAGVSPGDQRAQEVEASHGQRVAPWLSLNAEVGNIYTGSLFLALIDYLRHRNRTGPGLVSLFSYGSGCGAAWGFARTVPGVEGHAAALDPAAQLAARERISIEEYEEIMALVEVADRNDAAALDAGRWHVHESFLYQGTRDHVRRYSEFPG